jgi:hypothetical protein
MWNSGHKIPEQRELVLRGERNHYYMLQYYTLFLHKLYSDVFKSEMCYLGLALKYFNKKSEAMSITFIIIKRG